MPTVRYEVRGEYGLGSEKLYEPAARRGDPEATLEGVAMAGLVGLLKQLGDLAEFASGIFQDLHEEVMATSHRGHGLMLRVRQIETDWPLIEKAFLCQNKTNFSYNNGVNWHPKLQVDHNLIIRARTPQFILDPYEECRGPPDLSMLDRYDAAGYGASLKRYSNPEVFKAALTSSGNVEAQLEQEENVDKISKKGKYYGNGDASRSLSASEVYSKLQFKMSTEVQEELPITQVKLKSKPLYKETASYTECLHQVLLREENCGSTTLKGCNDIEMKPIPSRESTTEIPDTLLSTFADTERNPTKVPTKKETADMEGLGLTTQEIPQLSPKFREGTAGTEDDYLSKSSGLPETDQMELSSDDEWRTEGSSGGYISDNVSSDVDNYMDARNMMESGVDTDSEINVRANRGLTSMATRIKSSTYKVFGSRSQCSGSDFDQNYDSVVADFDKKSNSVLLATSCKTDTTTGHDIYSSDDNLHAQMLNRNTVNLDTPANLDGYIEKAPERSPNQWQNCEAELRALESFLSAGKCTEMAFSVNHMSKYTEQELSSSSLTNSASFLSATTVSDTEHFNKTSSNFVDSTHGVVKYLDEELPCTSVKSATTSQAKDVQLFQCPVKDSGVFSDAPSQVLLRENTPESDYLENNSERLGLNDNAVTFGRSAHNSERQDGQLPENPAILVGDLSPSPEIIMGMRQKSAQLATASQSAISMLHTYSFSSSKCSISMQSQDSPDEMENFGAPQDDSESPRGEVTLDNLSLESLSDVKDPRGPGNMDSTKFVSPCLSNGEIRGDTEQPSEEPIISEDAVGAKTVLLGDPSAMIDIGAEVCPQDVGLDQTVPEIDEDSVPVKFTEVNKVCMPHIPDSSVPSDASLSCSPHHSTLSEHDKKGLPVKNTESNYTDSSKIDEDLHSEALLVCHQESAGEEMEKSSHLLNDAVELLEEETGAQSESIPNIISFERYLYLKKGGNDDKSTDAMKKQPNLHCQPDSHETTNNVSFSEFLKLTQMDGLLDTKEAVSLDPPQSKKAFSLSKSKVTVPELSKQESATEYHLISNDATDSPASNVSGHREPHRSFCSCSSPSDLSNMQLLAPSDFSLSFPESAPQQSSEKSWCAPGSDRSVMDSFQSTMEELPPLPPLPPLEWRIGKLQIGQPISNLEKSQSSFGQNLFTALSTIDNKLLRGSVTARGEIIPISNPSTPIVAFQTEMPLPPEMDFVQSTDSSHRNPLEDGYYLHGLETSNGGKAHQFSASEDKNCTSEKYESRFGCLPSTSGSNRYEHHTQNLDEKENPTYQTFVSTIPESEDRQPEYSIPGPIPVGDNAQMLAYKKSKKRLDLLNQPEDSSSENAASHEESTLRKVAEGVQHSNKSKENEGSIFFDQIRNKSRDLKPTRNARPNLKGPLTNLRVAAILEKANTIRKACAGSDEDDDEDSWSD